MGFWGVTKNLLLGKPAFEAPKTESTKDWDDDDSPTDDFAEERAEKRTEVADTDLYNDNGVKQIPTAGVVAVKCNRGTPPHQEVWVTIKNQSERAIELDKIMLLGQKTELDYPLAPGAQREFRAYSGNSPTHDSYKKSELYYKDVVSGDYFRADHMIDYNYDTDGTYSVVGLQLLTPINDV